MVGYKTADLTSAEGTSFVRSSIMCLWYGTKQQSWEHYDQNFKIWCILTVSNWQKKM